MTPDAPICPYCGKPSRLLSGVMLYPHRPDLHDKSAWKCDPCDAWVGCHQGTTKPLGRLANAELREAKQRAHAAFDPFWKAHIIKRAVSRKSARSKGYSWLAEQLRIDRKDCHIGNFDVTTCERVVAICNKFRNTRKALYENSETGSREHQAPQGH